MSHQPTRIGKRNRSSTKVPHCHNVPLHLGSTSKDALPHTATDKRMERSGKGWTNALPGICRDDANDNDMYSNTMNSRRPLQAIMHALVCLLFIVPLHNFAQNLVPNGSFEISNDCPFTYGFEDGSSPQAWAAWRSSPDYFHGCASGDPDGNPLLGVPSNAVAFQHAQDGEAYVGLVVYSQFNEYREYVGTTLSTALVAGRSYDVTFWINLALGGQFDVTTSGSNNTSVLFTNRSIAEFATPGQPVFLNYAHVVHEPVLLDTVGWVMVSGSFVADSAYQHMVIGNFFSNDLTDHTPVVPSFQEVAYVLVDNVSVVEDLKTGMRTLDHEQPRSYYDASQQHFEIDWPGLRSYRVELVDLGGRLVDSGRSDQEKFRIGTASLPQGLYCAIIASESAVHTVKFVKH